MIIDFKNSSIKTRIIVNVVLLLAVVFSAVSLILVVFVTNYATSQTDKVLQAKANIVMERLDQRLSYLTENTLLFAQNELVIDTLINNRAELDYLPFLVENFIAGKDVVSLSIVDFDGQPIHVTADIPTYQNSKALRSALAYGQATSFINAERRLVTINPISFFATTQGALVVEFDLLQLLDKAIGPQDSSFYLKLTHELREVFSKNVDPEEQYRHYIMSADTLTENVKMLNIGLELGIPEAEFKHPIQAIIINIMLITSIGLLLGIWMAVIAGNKLVAPILQLFQRVTDSSVDPTIKCSPLDTNDELESLAQAFDKRTLQLEREANYDPLTGLPNRRLLADRLQHAIDRADAKANKLAVMFIDLDRFKEINDSLGHDIGDVVLTNVAQRIQGVLSPTDTFSRQGGDEFIVLLEDLHDNAFLNTLLHQILHQFEEPIEVIGHSLYMTASIGIAIYPDDGNTMSKLLSHADTAMYRAKSSGRNMYMFFQQNMTSEAFKRIQIENELRSVTSTDQLKVFFQPQIDATTNQICGAEALIRWFHPSMGMVPPDVFIPIAEDADLITQIDSWIIEQTVAFYMQWHAQGIAPPSVSINMSMLDLSKVSYLTTLRKLSRILGDLTACVYLELTESQVMKNPERNIGLLKKIKALGFKLAIDDFGTGHSSLSYLKKLPIDKLKIDRSFVKDLPHDEEDSVLASAIISMAKSLHLDVIAEGADDNAQVDFLVSHGCHEIQGYIYSPPIDEARFREQFLEK